MKTGYLSSIAAGCCLLAACGSQASPDYVGESLLTLSGRVEIAGSMVEGPLRPALAFRSRTPGTTELHFIEGQTTGAFPSDFTLRVTAPPPKVVIDRARMRHKVDPDYPPFPVAFITAVGDDLPSTIDAEPSQIGTNACVGDPDDPCEVSWEWCLNNLESDDHSDSKDECYSETRECAPEAIEFEDCTLSSSEGNPDVRDYPWNRLAGMSERLMVIWLAESLAADDPVAVHFELPELAAGYHAFEVTRPSDEERAAVEQCLLDVTELSIEQYNAEHGTEWMLDDVLPCRSRLHHYEACFSGELNEVLNGLYEYFESGLEQLGCVREIENEHRLLSEDETEHISVRIAPDVRPLGERGTW